MNTETKAEQKDHVRKPLPKSRKLANSIQTRRLIGGNIGSDPTMITRVACYTKGCES